MPIFKMNGFRKARLAKEMTQLKAAKAIGVAPTTIIQWENGSDIPQRRNLEKAAEVYGVTTQDLLSSGT